MGESQKHYAKLMKSETKDYDCRIPLIFHSRKGRPIGTEDKLVVAWGLAGRLTTKGNKGTFLFDGNVLILDCSAVYMTVHSSKLKLHLKE